MPNCMRPLELWKNLYQKPTVGSWIMRMSPAQLAPDEGLKSFKVTPSVAHPVLLAALLPYPPMPVVEITVEVVPGMAVLVGVAGIGAVFVIVMMS